MHWSKTCLPPPPPLSNTGLPWGKRSIYTVFFCHIFFFSYFKNSLGIRLCNYDARAGSDHEPEAYYYSLFAGPLVTCLLGMGDAKSSGNNKKYMYAHRQGRFTRNNGNVETNGKIKITLRPSCSFIVKLHLFFDNNIYGFCTSVGRFLYLPIGRCTREGPNPQICSSFEKVLKRDNMTLPY